MIVKEKEIVFDMDGTIADLYGVENWLDMLRNENPLPYEIASPMYNMKNLAYILNALKEQGWIITVTSWLAMNSSKEYKKLVRQAKREWLEKWHFPYDEIHLVQYGTPKHRVTKADRHILVDDNENVRNAWNGETINAQENIFPALIALLGE